MSSTNECDYLGVKCRRDLRWSSNSSKVCNKANKTLELLRRILKPCSQYVKEQAYFTMVRPIVEYAAAAWNPYTNRDVTKIEQVQKNAARFVTNVYDPYQSTSGLVTSLGWTTLENRRLLAQCTMFYKIRNNLVNISFPHCVQENPRSSRYNSSKYRQVNSDVLAFSYSFFPRTIRTWNCLPNSAVSAPTIEKFKSASALCLDNVRAPHHLRRL